MRPHEPGVTRWSPLASGRKPHDAYEECAVLVERDYLPGEFLDGAALAAQVLGRKNLVNQLEKAWLGAPSLARRVRWLLAGEPSTAALRKRAPMHWTAVPRKHRGTSEF